MKTTETNTPSEYMILFRSTDWYEGRSLEEMQAVLDRTMAWFDTVREQGVYKAAQPLHETGKVLSGKSGRPTIIDGPFAESKETVGGYLIIAVPTLEAAVEIARGWPLLDWGGTVEVRPLAQECPGFERLRRESAAAAAV